jgi:hypothetical protein
LPVSVKAAATPLANRDARLFGGSCEIVDIQWVSFARLQLKGLLGREPLRPTPYSQPTTLTLPGATILPELRDDLIDVIAEHAFSCSSPRSYVAMSI